MIVLHCLDNDEEPQLTDIAQPLLDRALRPEITGITSLSIIRRNNRQGSHPGSCSLPRGHPCATGEYRKTDQKALVDHVRRPWMARFGYSMLDVEIATHGLESMASERHLLFSHDIDVLGRPAIARTPAESNAVKAHT